MRTTNRCKNHLKDVQRKNRLFYRGLIPVHITRAIRAGLLLAVERGLLVDLVRNLLNVACGDTHAASYVDEVAAYDRAYLADNCFWGEGAADRKSGLRYKQPHNKIGPRRPRGRPRKVLAASSSTAAPTTVPQPVVVYDDNNSNSKVDAFTTTTATVMDEGNNIDHHSTATNVIAGHDYRCPVMMVTPMTSGSPPYSPPPQRGADTAMHEAEHNDEADIDTNRTPHLRSDGHDDEGDNNGVCLPQPVDAAALFVVPWRPQPPAGDGADDSDNNDVARAYDEWEPVIEQLKLNRNEDNGFLCLWEYYILPRLGLDGIDFCEDKPLALSEELAQQCCDRLQNFADAMAYAFATTHRPTYIHEYLTHFRSLRKSDMPVYIMKFNRAALQRPQLVN